VAVALGSQTGLTPGGSDPYLPGGGNGGVPCTFASGSALTPQSPLGEQIAYFELKAQLLSRIAAETDTDRAREAAAEAWDQVTALTTQLRQQVGDSDQP